MRDHWPHVFDQLEVDAHATQRQHDVGEHHRRVDAEAPHRLESDLGAELWLGDDLRQRVALT